MYQAKGVRGQGDRGSVGWFSEGAGWPACLHVGARGSTRANHPPLHPPGEQPNNPTRCTYAIEFRGNNPCCLATTTGGRGPFHPGASPVTSSPTLAHQYTCTVVRKRRMETKKENEGENKK